MQTQPTNQSRNSSRVLVNHNQKGNQVLSFIKKVPWEHANIPADYQVGANSGVLYLSLKYHRLKPEYIYERMKQLSNQYALRIILCAVDIDDHQQAIRELTKACILAGYTLFLAWSAEEAGRYIETFKAFEYKSPDMIKERVETDNFSKLTDCLVQVKSINKTDVLTLVSNFGSFKSIVEASPDELSLLPGFGDQKVTRLVEAVQSPFLLENEGRS
ncbi:DNA repair protein rad10 [Rhizoclosmatium globosum]|uniref:DNA excision repair protein ERCC-1 n=1 Tax=Rhizoclosmatium globosum TaxID=329046 RepID=A0A1Y2CHH6_9FUNG|nr:DNA repair protein rad10 [Rhizoclosmatium globosum]|eukprot:ORY46500.1 DNA repair protein rad10 [Rhizoclosmatium globosum]